MNPHAAVVVGNGFEIQIATRGEVAKLNRDQVEILINYSASIMREGLIVMVFQEPELSKLHDEIGVILGRTVAR